MSDDYKYHAFTATDGVSYELRMSPKAHRYSYRPEGEESWVRLPSVTTVGKAAGGFDSGTALRWQRRLIGEALYTKLNEILTPVAVEECLAAADTSRDSAADRGTQIHEWMEYMFNADGDATLIFPSHIGDECRAIAAWAGEWNVRPILVEQIVCHVPMGYAGTLDLLALYTCPDTGDERVGLFDLKTGKGAYPQSFNQLSAYAEALEWMGASDLPETRHILHLPEGAQEVTVVAPLHEHVVDWTAFRAAHNLYEYNNAARRSGRN